MAAAASLSCLSDMDLLYPGEMEFEGQVMAEYVWLGGNATDLRSKTKVLDSRPECPEDCPVISVDGSLCGQGSSECCELFLKPRKIFKDPFRGGDHILVLCDTFQVNEANGAEPVPHSSNNRVPCEAVQNAGAECEAMYAAEQDFMMLDPASGLPLGFVNSFDSSAPQKPFFCGAGHGVAAGRKLAEQHMQACLHAGLRMGGFNAGAAAGVWSYKLGPCSGVDFADQLWASRYLLARVSEGGGAAISFEASHPSTAIQLSCRVKFSTRDTRSTAIGLMALQQHVARLEASHMQHMMAYGRGRGGGAAEGLQRFSCSAGGKSSVMIPIKTVMQKAGYLVDRRPAASMDPYLVSALLLATTAGMPLPVPQPAPAAPKQEQPEPQQQLHQLQQQQQQQFGAAPAAAPVPVPAATKQQQAAWARACPMPGSSPGSSHRSGPLSSHPSCIPTPRGSMPGPAVMSLGTMQQLVAMQLQARLPAAPRGFASPAQSCSWSGADSGATSTLDSQEVLIDELGKFDRLSPGTPPYQLSLGECSDECSDGTSPETMSGPLACAARSEVMW